MSLVRGIILLGILAGPLCAEETAAGDLKLEVEAMIYPSENTVRVRLWLARGGRFFALDCSRRIAGRSEHFQNKQAKENNHNDPKNLVLNLHW